MIDDKDLIPIQKSFPRVHDNTKRSWWKTGVIGASGKRVKLQTIRIGGKIYVTQMLIDAFIEACSAAAPAEDELRSPAERVRSTTAARAELEEMGVR